MPPDLSTTNVLLGVLAVVAVIEALVVVAMFGGLVVTARRVIKAIDGIESRHVAPTSARVNAILDDVQDVTRVVRSGFGGVDQSVGWVLRQVRRVART
jgi:hypothetical protein